MNELATKSSGDLINLIHNSDGNLAIPKPFEREIFLFDTFIAGTSHIDGIEELAKYLKKDDRLTFLREPENKADKKAIKIQTENGTKLGYIPRADNAVFSRLMDAGKFLFGKISDIGSLESHWIKIEIKVFLKD